MEAKTSFSYNFYDKKPVDLIYNGDAHFMADGYLRLVKSNSDGRAGEDSFGRVLYPNVVQMYRQEEKADFETTVTFILNPQSDKPADGLVFFMVPMGYSFPARPIGGSLGLYKDQANPQVFAVEFDIFPNHWDPFFPHVGINIESRVSKMVTQIPLSFLGKEVTLKITYAAAIGLISARATAGRQSVETSFVCDLSKILPQRVNIGLAAATGAYYAIHNVNSWKFDSDITKK
ncbi:non-specific serine/threonine protein kinase [Salvia divinorum]|uniref:Non-specific serine/threonine protein kinase n=1 Tax=Salvia divinorum TaxID=28513 RepID=A0ABD1FKU3_SALDI